MNNQKTAFVLGGGSIKGAYQIGVMHGLIQKGIAPDIITGISVGSLNGLLYAHYLGIARNPAQAINMGATDIYVLANHPEKVSSGFNESKSLMAMVDRIMEITVNNTLNNDIMEAQLINRLVKHRAAPGKRHVNITVLRPAKSIGIDIENFTAADITNMIMSGSASVQKI